MARLIGWLLACLFCSSFAVSQAGENEPALLPVLQQAAQPLTGQANDYHALLQAIGEAKVLLLGETTHGSAEFYRERQRIIGQLVAEKGFGAVILETGWAPVLPANRYVRGQTPGSLSEALAGFRRFPRWMWRNAEFAATLEYLRQLNRQRGEAPVALYGMDLLEATDGIDEVLAYLRRHHPAQLAAARRDYRCFAPYRRPEVDQARYGEDVAAGRMPSCQRQLSRRAGQLRQAAEQRGDADSFAAWMAARALAGAEAHARVAGVGAGLDAWNLRERFMAESIRLLLQRHPKVIVLAHNTHQGDARATAHAERGILSLGQLLREEMGDGNVFLLGFSTYRGTVRAAGGGSRAGREWPLHPAAEGSWHQLLHQTGIKRFLLLFRGNETLGRTLDEARLERAIGVIYAPDNEAANHYVASRISRRYDALIHIDHTSAVPLLPR